MFCHNCSFEVTADASYCSSCGKELQKPSTIATSSFGRPSNYKLKSFIQYKTGKGRPKKSQLLNKHEEQDSGEVIIKIGLMFWDGSQEELKEKRGKRIAIRVQKDANYHAILETALLRWKNFRSNFYQPDKEYTLLYEDLQEAVFLPGSAKEFFSLEKYKAELMKDFKRISLFLCSSEDFELSTSSGAEGDKESDEMPPCKVPKCEEAADDQKMSKEAISVLPDSIPSTSRTSIDEACTTAPSTSTTSASAPGSWFLDEEMNRLFGDDDHLDDFSDHENDCIVNDNTSSDAHTHDHKSKAVQNERDVRDIAGKKVIIDGKTSLFIVVRRNVVLSRFFSLWQRATSKVSPEHVLRVKFMGEEGIDSGALAKEFLTMALENIAKRFFPGGIPIHSTNDIQNGNFNIIGQIAAVSIAQGGPGPCFLAPSVYEMLANKDISFTSVKEEEDKYLTASELDIVNKIRSGKPQDHTDLILEHGYTGRICCDNLDSIIGAVIVSLYSRRLLAIRELRKGLELFGVDEIISKHSDAARSLFVVGGQKPVDANYLASILRPEFSEEGSRRRLKEEEIMDHFQDVIIKLEDEKVSGYDEAVVWKSDNGDEEDTGTEQEEERFTTAEMSPAGIMGWLTGQKHREEGLKITVHFDHCCMDRNPKHKICFPYVGACGKEITIPVRHMETLDEFKKVFLLAFGKGQSFSKA